MVWFLVGNCRRSRSRFCRDLNVIETAELRGRHRSSPSAIVEAQVLFVVHRCITKAFRQPFVIRSIFTYHAGSHVRLSEVCYLLVRGGAFGCSRGCDESCGEVASNLRLGSESESRRI